MRRIFSYVKSGDFPPARISCDRLLITISRLIVTISNAASNNTLTKNKQQCLTASLTFTAHAVRGGRVGGSAGRGREQAEGLRTLCVAFRRNAGGCALQQSGSHPPPKFFWWENFSLRLAETWATKLQSADPYGARGACNAPL